MSLSHAWHCRSENQVTGELNRADLLWNLRSLAPYVYMSLGQTKIVEDLFKPLRHREEQDTPNNNLTTARQWLQASMLRSSPIRHKAVSGPQSPWRTEELITNPSGL